MTFEEELITQKQEDEVQYIDVLSVLSSFTEKGNVLTFCMSPDETKIELGVIDPIKQRKSFDHYDTVQIPKDKEKFYDFLLKSYRMLTENINDENTNLKMKGVRS